MPSKNMKTKMRNSTDDSNIDFPGLHEFEMVSLIKRLDTYQDWPFDQGSCTAEKMAEAGFYHCPTDQEPDLVKCFFCLKELDGWEPEDNPWEEHKSHSAKCAFLTVQEEEITVRQFLELVRYRMITRIEKTVKARCEEFKECAREHREELLKLAS